MYASVSSQQKIQATSCMHKKNPKQMSLLFTQRHSKLPTSPIFTFQLFHFSLFECLISEQVLFGSILICSVLSELIRDEIYY